MGFVAGTGAVITFVGYVSSILTLKSYGIHIGRIMALHVRLNRKLLFSYSMFVFVFPAGLLVRQANILPLVVPEAYRRGNDEAIC